MIVVYVDDRTSKASKQKVFFEPRYYVWHPDGYFTTKQRDEAPRAIKLPQYKDVMTMATNINRILSRDACPAGQACIGAVYRISKGMQNRVQKKLKKVD